MQLPKWVQSSQDPSKVSLTLKWVIAGLVPIVIMVSKVFGFEVPTETLKDLLQQVSDTLGQIVIAIWGVVSLIGTLYGLWRKIRDLFKK